MGASSMLATVYATDEDCFNEGGADFGVIVPTSNQIAMGTDGVFASGNLWSLSSASNAFAAQGAAAGQVVQLSGSKYPRAQYLAVDTVSTNAIGLRRCGMALGVGMPPGPVGGATGITFQILTLYPQVENTAFELNEQYSLDPNLPGYRSAGDVYNQRVFRRLTALRVFYLQYMNMNRAKAGDFDDKVARYLNEYRQALDTATVRWGPTGQSQPTTTRFSTRLVR